MDSRSRVADLLALVPAAAVPLVFLHRHYQPHGSIGRVDVYGGDVAIAVTIGAALVAARLLGWRRLLAARTLWAVALALLVVLAVSCLWTPLDQPGRRLVTMAKVVEYALLAPAVVLLLRTRVHVDRFLVAFVAWSVAAAGWGVLQFLGLVSEFEGKRPGQREVSFLGIHDFGAFAGAALAIGFAGIVLRERPRLSLVAIGAGTVGAILAASVFAYAGIALAAAAAVIVGLRARTLTARRVLALVAVMLTVGAGLLALRTYDVTDFLSFLGGESTPSSTEVVQTGSQRVMLAYIGIRIWRDHPLLGVGFGRSTDRYQPYLDDAERRYPDQPEEAFPSPENRWGVQNYWVQLLADTGLVGFLLAVSAFALALALALRAPPAAAFYGLVAVGWILVAVGSLNAFGIAAGNPTSALVWFAFGLAATIGVLE